MTNRTQGSLIIEQFLNYISECEKKKSYACSKVGEEDKRCGDLLHELELGDLPTRERNAVAKQLETNRKDRRYYKDIVEETSPVCDYMSDPKHRASIEKLKQLLGEVRKVEKYHESRTYIPRIEKDKAKKGS